MADLNDTELDGRRLSVADLQAAADALPFMGSRRLVLVRGLLERCNPRSGDRESRKALSEALVAYLPTAAPTTRLVFVEGKLDKRNPVLKWATKWSREQKEPDQSAVIREFVAPSAKALPEWLQRQMEREGGSLDRPGAVALASALTGEGDVDLRLAQAELVKLQTYAGDRAVTADDVELLVTPISIESIFAFVDALSARDGPTATTVLHRYLDRNEPPLRILALVARQIRLITQARLLFEAGVPVSEMNERLDVPPFVVRKLARQAQNFTLPFLAAALRRLRDIDTEIKTGRIDPVLALDLFVAGACGQADDSGG
jgi:DNA polymerase-3 subunit delta